MDIKCLNNMKDRLDNIGVAMAVMVLASVVLAIVMMFLFRAYGVYGCEMKTLLLASLVMVAVVCLPSLPSTISCIVLLPAERAL